MFGGFRICSVSACYYRVFSLAIRISLSYCLLTVNESHLYSLSPSCHLLLVESYLSSLSPQLPFISCSLSPSPAMFFTHRHLLGVFLLLLMAGGTSTRRHVLKYEETNFIFVQRRAGRQAPRGGGCQKEIPRGFIRGSKLFLSVSVIPTCEQGRAATWSPLPPVRHKSR